MSAAGSDKDIAGCCQESSKWESRESASTIAPQNRTDAPLMYNTSSRQSANESNRSSSKIAPVSTAAVFSGSVANVSSAPVSVKESAIGGTTTCHVPRGAAVVAHLAAAAPRAMVVSAAAPPQHHLIRHAPAAPPYWPPPTSNSGKLAPKSLAQGRLLTLTTKASTQNRRHVSSSNQRPNATLLHSSTISPTSPTDTIPSATGTSTVVTIAQIVSAIGKTQLGVTNSNLTSTVSLQSAPRLTVSNTSAQSRLPRSTSQTTNVRPTVSTPTTRLLTTPHHSLQLATHQRITATPIGTGIFGANNNRSGVVATQPLGRAGTTATATHMTMPHMQKTNLSNQIVPRTFNLQALMNNAPGPATAGAGLPTPSQLKINNLTSLNKAATTTSAQMHSSSIANANDTSLVTPTTIMMHLNTTNTNVAVVDPDQSAIATIEMVPSNIHINQGIGNVDNSKTNVADDSIICIEGNSTTSKKDQFIDETCVNRGNIECLETTYSTCRDRTFSTTTHSIKSCTISNSVTYNNATPVLRNVHMHDSNANNTSTQVFNQSLSIVKLTSSPRPSILRKRDHEGIQLKAAKNLNTLLAGMPPVSPPPMRSDSRDNGHSSSGSTTISATSSPGMSENTEDAVTSSMLTINDNCSIKEEDVNVSRKLNDIMSPRKKPRKQQLTGNSDILSVHNDDMQFLSETNSCKTFVKKSADIVHCNDSNLLQSKITHQSPSPTTTTIRKPATASILNTYRQTWKATHNHYLRYSDVKPKDERRPTIVDLSNQYKIQEKINGWKIYHLSAQMEDLANEEHSVYNQLSDLLKCMETIEDDGFSKEVNHVNELIKGNLQRIKIINDGMNEAKSQMLKIFDHKVHVTDIVGRCASKRNYKKREKP